MAKHSNLEIKKSLILKIIKKILIGLVIVNHLAMGEGTSTKNFQNKNTNTDDENVNNDNEIYSNLSKEEQDTIKRNLDLIREKQELSQKILNDFDNDRP